MSRQKQYEQVLGDDVGDAEDVSEVDFSNEEDGAVVNTAMTGSRFGKAFQRLSQEDDSYNEMFDIVDDDRTEPTSNVHRNSFHSQHSDGKLTPATLPETPADGLEQAHASLDSSGHSGNGVGSNHLNPFSSFDLDDDELDDLQRYDFHSNRESEELHSYSTGKLRRSSSRSTSNGDNCFTSFALALYMLWDMFKTARLESRRRRAERLLAIPDEHYIERSCLFLSSWCDLTDRGIYVLVAAVVLWMVAVYCFGDPWWLWIGVTLITMRILLRPAYWYIWGRRIQQKRQATMALYDELNGGSPVGGGRVVIELPAPTNARDGEAGSDMPSSRLSQHSDGEFPGDFVMPPFESDYDGGNQFTEEFEPGLDDDTDMNKSGHSGAH